MTATARGYGNQRLRSRRGTERVRRRVVLRGILEAAEDVVLPPDLGEIATTLVPRGSFVFSVEHPIFMAPTNPGFVTDGDGRAVWPLDRYLQEGQRVTNWLAPGVVKYHRTIEVYLRALRRSGLVLSDLVEWGPSAEQIRRVPAWATERDRPPFLLISATRP